MKVELDIIDRRIILDRLEKIGVHKYIEEIFHYMDCTRVYENGMRPMQTIGYPYARLDAEFSFCIKYGIENNLFDANKATEYSQRYNTIHKANLAYEEVNPPIIYAKSKKTTKRTPKKLVTVDMFTNETIIETDYPVNSKPKRETKKQREEKAKSEKLSKLSFKFGKV